MDSLRDQLPSPSMLRTPVKLKAPALDRFIPSRNNEAFQSRACSVMGSTKLKDTQRQRSATPAQVNYQSQLSRNLFGEDSPCPRKVLNFAEGLKSPKKAEAPPSKNQQAQPRLRASRSADLVLDAPELPDNFYLNLLAWSSENILAIGLGPAVYLWNCNNGAVREVCPEHKTLVCSVSWGSDGKSIAIGFETGDVEIWNVSPLKKLRRLPTHNERVAALAWTQAILTTGSKDKSIANHDVRARGQVVATFCGHKDEICGLRFSSSNNNLASGGNDNMTYIWDTRFASINRNSNGNTTHFLHSLKHDAAVKALAWCPGQNNLLATGGGTSDPSLRFWNVHSGELLRSVNTGSQVVAINWSLDGKELASAHGFSNNTVRLWSYPSMLRIGELKGHKGRILHMAQGPDGQSLATAAADETLRIWKAFSSTADKGILRPEGAVEHGSAVPSFKTKFGTTHSHRGSRKDAKQHYAMVLSQYGRGPLRTS